MDPKAIETEAIISMELKWLIDCDSISICATRSSFLEVEDDVSIGFFTTRSNRASFNETPEVRDFEIDKRSDFYSNESSASIQILTDTLDEVAIAQESHYFFHADALEDNNSTEGIVH